MAENKPVIKYVSENKNGQLFIYLKKSDNFKGKDAVVLHKLVEDKILELTKKTNLSENKDIIKDIDGVDLFKITNGGVTADKDFKKDETIVMNYDDAVKVKSMINPIRINELTKKTGLKYKEGTNIKLGDVIHKDTESNYIQSKKANEE